MDYRDSFIQEYISTHRWALQREVLDSLCSVVERHIAGDKLSDDQIRNIASSRRKTEDPRKYEMLGDGNAIIHVSGVIAKYSHMVNDISQPQGTSVEFLSQQLSLALSDGRVEKIFLRIESPGGSIPGLPDFADQVYQASFEKPIIAFADDQASSAAYWIGSQANAFYANQSAMVGSIGVYMVVPDASKRAEMLGIKFNIVNTGENKGAGYPGTKVTEPQLSAFQDSVDSDFAMFLSAILRGRSESGLDMEALEGVADGRQFSAAAAVENNLIDGIMTLDAALALAPPAVRMNGTVAAASAGENHIENFRKENKMPKETKTTTPADAAENVSDTQASAEQERARILSIQSALSGPEFKAVADKAIAEGSDLTTAKAAAFDVAQTVRGQEKTASDAKTAELQQRLDAIAKSGHAEELTPQAETTPTEPLAEGTTGDATAFDTAVTAYVNAGMTKSQAINKAQKDSPANHQAWVASKQPQKK